MILSFHVSQAFQAGPLALSGSGCFGSQQLILVDSETSRYALPIRVRLNKKADSSFDRKTCNMRLPISLNAGEKLQIMDLSQSVRVIAAKGSDVKSNLNLSILGKKANPLIFNVTATEETINVIETVKTPGLIAESLCGKDAMITGDLNILATGTAKALASTGTALVTLKVVTCN